MSYNEDFKPSQELNDLVKENIPKLKSLLFNNSISFFFVPSVKLKELVIQNKHPIAKKVPNGMKELILGGKPFAIQKRMVYELLTGQLDKDNSFILKNGDIRVLEGNESLLNINGTKNDN